MSKSLGNVIDPIAIVDEYNKIGANGADILRYYLARHINSSEDSDFTMDKFKEAYNADLANGLGNFVSRVMKLSEQYVDTKDIPADIYLHDLKYLKKANNHRKYFQALNEFDFNVAVETIWEVIAFGNRLMTKNEVFRSVKEDKDTHVEFAKNFLQRIWRISVMLEPIMPETSKKIQDAVRANKKPENLFPRL